MNLFVFLSILLLSISLPSQAKSALNSADPVSHYKVLKDGDTIKVKWRVSQKNEVPKGFVLYARKDNHKWEKISNLIAANEDTKAYQAKVSDEGYTQLMIINVNEGGAFDKFGPLPINKKAMRKSTNRAKPLIEYSNIRKTRKSTARRLKTIAFVD